MKPIAHTPAKPGGDPHDLAQHSYDTAFRAKEFAAPWGGGAWAENGGLWHDFGKYSADFKDYLAKGGQGPRVDHSTAGAIHAKARLGLKGELLSYVIAGHHAGLPDNSIAMGGASALSARLSKTKLHEAALRGDPDEAILKGVDLTRLPKGIDLPFFIRMIFSAVCDADRLDTERFMNPELHAKRRDPTSMAVLARRLLSFMGLKTLQAPDTPINRLRGEMLAQCGAASTRQPGLFSLTGPLGLGKTLSGLTFALKHAVSHGKSRVIYVAPYTGIIEQTADVIRAALGDDEVLEHHSNLDPDDETAASAWHRLAAENWDCSVVVTTAVQLFESLFAAKPSRCRKLHRIANSVIILDEAHLVPTEFLAPIMRVLNELMNRYSVTVVLASATQPALDVRPGFDGLSGPHGRREIVINPEAMRIATKRVNVHLPDDLLTPSSWQGISERLRSHDSVMCVVSERRHALELHRQMPEGTFHLSALMCGQHRAEVIATIRERLARNEPTRLIATQLVEAGVDLDFPTVFRALAGLDSIAQAGGRCNREGKHPRGDLVVFVPPERPKSGFLRTTYDLTLALLAERPKDPFSQEMFRRYFESLYWLKAEHLDQHGINELLPVASLNISFRTAARRFRMIDDIHETVIVPWGEKGEAVVHELRDLGDAASKHLLRRAQRYSVGISTRQAERMENDGLIVRCSKNLWTAVSGYDRTVGLKAILES